MEPEVIFPIGWESGRIGTLFDVLGSIQLEMLGHRADINEAIERTLDPQQKTILRDQAEILEKYAIAISSVYFQLEPAKFPAENVPGFITLAKKHHIVMPAHMRGVVNMFED